MTSRSPDSRHLRSSLPKALVGIVLAVIPGGAIYVFLSAGADRERVETAVPPHPLAEIPAAPAVLAPLPIVTEFEHVSAAEAEGQVDVDELVMGVVIDGQARAYPVNMMHGPEREIFNDELGGRSIAATW